MLKKFFSHVLKDLAILALVVSIVVWSGIVWVTVVNTADKLKPQLENVIEAPPSVPGLDMKVGTLDVNPLGFGYGRNAILRI